MKKFCLALIFALICTPAIAKTIEVEALGEFSTANPPETMSVKIVNDVVINEAITVPQGTILTGKIKVTNPKNLKRNATFTFVPSTYTNTDGTTGKVKRNYFGKYTKPLDKGGLAKSAALTVGNHFVKGLSMGVRTVEGVVKNEEDNRFKSGAKALYESSPVSYLEKGNDIVIKQNEHFYLNFKSDEE